MQRDRPADHLRRRHRPRRTGAAAGAGRQAEFSIGLLAAGVAHEVNTPLAVISTYAQMLAKQVAEDEQKSMLLDKIAKQTFRASEIVNSLLNFSRTSTAEFGEVDLNRVIEETSRCWSTSWRRRGVQYRARTRSRAARRSTATPASCSRFS